MSLRFLTQSLSTLPLIALAAGLAGCSGSIPDGARLGFMASGDIAVTDQEARTKELVGRFHVEGERVEGTLAFTHGGRANRLRGTLEGGSLHFSNVELVDGGEMIGGSYAGASTYLADELEIALELADDGMVTSATITASGVVTDSSGDEVFSADYSFDFDGGADTRAPEFEVFSDHPDQVRGPVEPVVVVFDEPVVAELLTADAFTVTAAGQPVAIDVELPPDAGIYATWATIRPRGHWPLGGDLTIAPTEIPLPDLNDNAWAKSVGARGSEAPPSALVPTTFEDDSETAFMTPVGPAQIEPMPPLLAFQDQERALLVPASGAWARIDLPAEAKELKLRVAYVMSGFGTEGEPDWVWEDLGWSIAVAGDAEQVVDERDMVGQTIKTISEGPIPQSAGPIDVVTLDVAKFAGKSVVLALQPRSFHLPPVSIDGILAVDWIEF